MIEKSSVTKLLVPCILASLGLLHLFCLPALAEAAQSTAAKNKEQLSLEKCIAIALEHNQQRKISQLSVNTAEYQHQQVLYSFWPQLNLNLGYNRQDEDLNFTFPQNNTSSLELSTPQEPLSGQDVTISGESNIYSSLNVAYPIYAGGLRSAAANEADARIEAAKQTRIRTGLEIVRDVQRMYYTAVLAKRLASIGKKTLKRLQTTCNLTKKLNSEGSGSVSKLDYLNSRVAVENSRSNVEMLAANVELAEAALANTMGLDWNTELKLSDSALPYNDIKADVASMVANAYRFNPDWKELTATLSAAEAQVAKKKSGRLPKIVLTGTLWHLDSNVEDTGNVTAENENGWSVGVGLQMPIFSGLLTKNKILAAKNRVKQLEAQQILLRKGLALRIKHGVIEMGRAKKVRTASKKAAAFALEHRKLANEAYANELISTKEVLESQLTEAQTLAKTEMTLYEHLLARIEIDFILGSQISQLLGIDN